MKNIKDDQKQPTQEQKLSEEEIIKKSLYQSAEGIIKQLIDKMIASAVRSTQIKEVDDQMGIFCFNNLKVQMTSLFESTFINYTDDLFHDEPKLLWEQTPPPENTWVELPEPGNPELDRYESTNINFVEIKKDQDKDMPTSTTTGSVISDNKNLNKKKGTKKEAEPLYLNNNNVINEVEEKSSLSGFDGEVKIENGALPELSGIDNKISESLNMTDADIKNEFDNAQETAQKEKPKISENKNTENKITENKNKENKNTENIPPKKEESSKNINKNNNLKVEEKKELSSTKPSTNQPSTALPPIKKKGKNVPILDYPFSDIPGVEEEFNHDNLEPANVEFLRREREELIQKRIIENKIKESQSKAAKPKEETDKVKKKLIDTNRLTFDSNGNIIHFRPYKLDNLTKDFAITRNTIKGFEYKPEAVPAKKKNAKKKDKEKEKEKEKEPEEVIKNFEEEKRTKEISNITNPSANDKDKFIPSGSNFQIISPNTGVIIKENNQSKEGPREFSKYFKKYSLQDYDKMLNDYVPLQNKTMLKNQLSINSNSKYMPTAPNNNSMINKMPSMGISNSNLESNNNINISEIPNNPLLTNNVAEQSSYLMEKDKSLNNNSSGININLASNNNPLLSSNLNSMVFNRYNESYNTMNMDNSIVMKKMGTGSLKLELENLKDLSTINPELITLPNRRRNILGNSFMRGNKTYKIKQPEKNVLSDFNRKIISTAGWGNETGNENGGFKDKDKNLVYSRHITKQQVLRELGSNILSGIKIKLPRDRKVDINNNI